MKNLFFLLCCILMVSCFNEPDLIYVPDSMRDLNIVTNFDWKATKDITVSFPQATVGVADV